MKYKLLLPLLLLVSQVNIRAQNHNGSPPVLSSADVEIFIANIRNIEKDFNSLEIDYKLQTDYKAFIESFKTNKEANDIVKKYGYKDVEEFVQKVWSISACYATITIETKGTPEMKSALRNIEEDESLSPEEKEQAKQQVIVVIETLSSGFLAAANEADLAVVKPYYDKLETLFEQDLQDNSDE
jgi:hypothetical protein